MSDLQRQIHVTQISDEIIQKKKKGEKVGMDKDNILRFHSRIFV